MTLFRSRGQNAPVTSAELFFDLVFVFAITQLSHSLLEQQSLAGIGSVLMLLLAVWWAWINTTWVTNWLDPGRTPVRLMLLVLMLTGLLLSTSLPEAFGSRGLVFAMAYVVIQVGRTSFIVWAARRHEDEALRRNFVRTLIVLCISAAF
jgi:low temperature requirement protein LtrA